MPGTCTCTWFVDSTNTLFAVQSHDMPGTSNTSINSTADNTEESDPPPAKRSRLFGSYFKQHAVPLTTSISSQISKYLDLNIIMNVMKPRTASCFGTAKKIWKNSTSCIMQPFEHSACQHRVQQLNACLAKVAWSQDHTELRWLTQGSRLWFFWNATVLTFK